MPQDGHGDKVIYSDEHRRLTELLREVREEAGMTQAQVAAGFGRPMDYVSRMEGGQRRIDVVEWLRFLRICGADPVTFLACLATAFDPPLALSTNSARRSRGKRGDDQID